MVPLSGPATGNLKCHCIEGGRSGGQLCELCIVVL